MKYSVKTVLLSFFPGVTGYLMTKHIITKQIPESLNHLCITQVNRDLNQFYMQSYFTHKAPPPLHPWEA